MVLRKQVSGRSGGTGNMWRLAMGGIHATARAAPPAEASTAPSVAYLPRWRWPTQSARQICSTSGKQLAALTDFWPEAAKIPASAHLTSGCIWLPKPPPLYKFQSSFDVFGCGAWWGLAASPWAACLEHHGDKVLVIAGAHGVCVIWTAQDFCLSGIRPVRLACKPRKCTVLPQDVTLYIATLQRTLDLETTYTM